MLRGTRILDGDDALTYRYLESYMRNILLNLYGSKMEEIIVPSIWEASTFKDKVGPENSKMMWEFKDKGNRDVCLIPEVTGLIQETWKNKWSKECSKKMVFYIQRCYRYERPQKGRYREFTQFGVELLGKEFANESGNKLAFKILKDLLFEYKGIQYNTAAKRGLSYYTADGFEASYEGLGAQKQIAGGGVYDVGAGFAIGLDRLMLVERDLNEKN